MKTMLTDSLYSIFSNIMDYIRQIWCSKKCEQKTKNNLKIVKNIRHKYYQKIIWQGNEFLLIDEKQKWLRLKAELLSYRTVQNLFKSEASTCISLSIQNSHRFEVLLNKYQKMHESKISWHPHCLRFSIESWVFLPNVDAWKPKKFKPQIKLYFWGNTEGRNLIRLSKFSWISLKHFSFFEHVFWYQNGFYSQRSAQKHH